MGLSAPKLHNRLRQTPRDEYVDLAVVIFEPRDR